MAFNRKKQPEEKKSNSHYWAARQAGKTIGSRPGNGVNPRGPSDGNCPIKMTEGGLTLCACVCRGDSPL